MKFRLTVLILAAVVFLSCGFAPAEIPKAENNSSDISATVPNEEALLFSRVENMLSHNFVYNDDFDFTSIMVDNAMLALIENCDEDGYIDRRLAEGFVYNMYGFDLSEYVPSPLFPEKEDAVFVIPRGIDTYSHEILSITVDGEYIIADSLLKIDSHEGISYDYNCRTLLLENGASAFGYNIVSSIYY